MTIVAINVGGALLPLLASLYLALKTRARLGMAAAVAIVAVVVHQVAQIVPGVGIAVPMLVPPLVAVVVALVLAYREAPAIAYVAGSLGALIGADLWNLPRIHELGAPMVSMVSIGGAGTFDGVFLSGMLAGVLAAWIAPRRGNAVPASMSEAGPRQAAWRNRGRSRKVSVMKSDIEIARAARLRPIHEVAAGLGLGTGDIDLYGETKAKVRTAAIQRMGERAPGKLVLVTAMTPTPAGEGKSTTTVGLGDAFRALGKRAIVTIREPSLGPCFGIKGGAAGGGYAQVVPMEDINLHFTGDFHAVTAAHNLLAAALDNHVFQGNALSIDSRRVVWKRVLDMNDRALRNIVLGLGGPAHGVPRESGFEITVASEIMAILCLATDLVDLKARLGRIIVAESTDGRLVTAGELRVVGSLAVLLKDALRPNLVQTIEGTPAFVHGGPFANIAHGCNSLAATRLALTLGEVVVTEAGFASDLGAEKFFDIKCRVGGLAPSAAVIVATVRALKMHGGIPREALGTEDVAAVERGLANLEKHVENVRQFGVPAVVALNHFTADSETEVKTVMDACERMGVPARVSRVWADGAVGGTDLAKAVLEAMDGPSKFAVLYPDELPLERKIEVIATRMYGAKGIDVLPAAAAKLKRFGDLGYGRLPVCMAKTQNSLSDDARKLGRPRDFTVTIRDAKVAAGAGFVVAYAGDILTMPGLPKVPAAEAIDLDEQGNVVGLF